MHCRTILSALIVSCIFCDVAFAQPAAEQTASDTTIDRVLNALAAYNSIDLKAKCRSEWENKNGKIDADSLIELLDVDVKRSGLQAIVTRKDATHRPNKPIWRSQQDAIIDSKGDLYDWQAKLDESQHQIAGNDGLALSLTSDRISNQDLVDREAIYAPLNDCGAVLWILGYFPLSAYLDGAPNALISPDGDSIKIVTHTELGDLTLLVSPSSGWLPTSFELVKLPNHQTVRGRVAEVYKNQVTAVTWSGKAEGFSCDASGHWAPSSISLVRRTDWTGKAIETAATAIDLKRIEFDPHLSESDFQSTIVLPRGWRVNIVGAQHLPYIWDGTKVVPTKLPAGSAEPHQLAKRQGFPTRTILISVNIVFAVIVVMLLRARARRNGASR